MAPERRLYAHRGASARLPENTLPAFQRGLDDGADSLEMDVHLTADGAVVVSHDGDGRRRAGVERAIRDCTLAEVRAWQVGTLPDGSPARIPTLAEVLEAFPAPRLNIDIKPRDPSVVPTVLRVITEHDAAERVTLTSFHENVLGEVRAQRYPGEIGLGPRELLQLRLLPMPVVRRMRWRGVAVQVPTSYHGLQVGIPTFIQRCHSLGLRVDYWVINDANAARTLLEAGADGIVTDDPASIAPVMATSSSRPYPPGAPTGRTAQP